MDLDKEIILNKIKKDLEKIGEEFLYLRYGVEDSEFIKTKMSEVLKKAQDSKIVDKDYNIYRTKLPRKMKKQHKKSGLVDITVSYRYAGPKYVSFEIEV